MPKTTDRKNRVRAESGAQGLKFGYIADGLTIHTDSQNLRELPDRRVFDTRFAACCCALSLLYDVNSPSLRYRWRGSGIYRAVIFGEPRSLLKKRQTRQGEAREMAGEG